jgi:hypothetical protein
MDLRTTRLSSKHASSLTSIASKLAPTKGCGHATEESDRKQRLYWGTEIPSITLT